MNGVSTNGVTADLYIYIYIYMFTCTCVYIYIERERDVLFTEGPFGYSRQTTFIFPKVPGREAASNLFQRGVEYGRYAKAG